MVKTWFYWFIWNRKSGPVLFGCFIYIYIYEWGKLKNISRFIFQRHRIEWRKTKQSYALGTIGLLGSINVSFPPMGRTLMVIQSKSSQYSVHASTSSWHTAIWMLDRISLFEARVYAANICLNTNGRMILYICPIFSEIPDNKDHQLDVD